MNEDVLHLGYLTLRLTREKSRKDDGEQDIKSRIYLLHVNGDISLEIKNEPAANYNRKGLVDIPRKAKKEDYPSWAKKIEREIAKKTHPDKLTGLDEKEVKEKTEMFLKAKKKIDEGRFIDLLPIALSLGIDFSKYENNFEKDISGRIRDIQIEITEIQKSVAWKWKDFNENQKIEAIEIILKQSGIKRTETQIKKAVRKRIKRKIGTRPKSLKEIRNMK